MSTSIKTSEENRKLCRNCTQCCEYVVVNIGEPRDKYDIDEIVWFLLHDITVFIDGDDTWNIKIHNRCNALDQEGKCTVYSRRPLVCREYFHDECERYKGKGYLIPKKIFNNTRDFLEYVNQDDELKKIDIPEYSKS